MDEMIMFIGILFSVLLGSCIGCASGENSMNLENQKKMIELNLAHYDHKTGKYTQDSISCGNDSCVIIRKNGE